MTDPRNKSALTPKIFLPSPKLQKVVKFYEWLEIGPNVSNETILVYPNLHTGLLFFFRGTGIAHLPLLNREMKLAPASLSPPTSTLVKNPNWRNLAILRVLFYDGAIYQLFSIPASEFENHSVDLSYCLDSNISFLHERLYKSIEPLEKIKLVEEYLLTKLRGSSTQGSVLSAVRNTIRRRGNFRVDKVAEELGLSRQHLNRLMMKKLGFSAKMGIEILRFNMILQDVNSAKASTITDLSYRYGFTDQAHFTHKFKSMTSVTPGNFLKARNKQLYNQSRDEEFSATEVER